MNISETNEKMVVGMQRQDEVETVFSNQNGRNALEITTKTAYAKQTSIPTEHDIKNLNVHVTNIAERHSLVPHTGQSKCYHYEQSNRDNTMQNTW